MGGWCAKRDTCRLYQENSGLPIERLCEPGQLDAYVPVVIVKPADGRRLNRVGGGK